MDHTICPGAKMLRQPKPEIFACTSCGGEVEIWSDEIRGACTKCGTTMMRDGTMSCLDWCAHGKDCVGEEVYDSYQRNKAITVKQRLFEELEKLSGGDADAIRIARESSRIAQDASQETDADSHIVMASCILRSVDSGSARKALLRVGFGLGDIDEVCGIIEALGDGESEDSTNTRIVRDACLAAAACT